jgi:hypothetical protein
MPRAVGMDDTSCIRQVLHQLTGAASMVEMYVCEKHVVNIGYVEILLREGIQQKWDAAIHAGVDVRCAPRFNDKVTRVVQQTLIFGINSDDAVV